MIGHDSYFGIGRDHKICEDYTLSGLERGIAYAIVCDGCSSAKRTDLGARLLAHAAKLILVDNVQYGYGEFGDRVIRQASESLSAIGEDWSILHSTLLTAFIRKDRLQVRMYGDGAVVFISDTFKRVVRVEYLSGAANYLAYRLNHDEQQKYLECFEMPVRVVTSQTDLATRNEIVVESEYHFDQQFEFNYPVEEWRHVSLLSDGINTFHALGEDKLNALDVVSRMTSFKTLAGEFVRRRMNAFEKDCRLHKVIHDDDIAISSVSIGKD